ncbi:hypothetical protein AKJ16_DCAP26323 [Drosera capensis]
MEEDLEFLDNGLFNFSAVICFEQLLYIDDLENLLDEKMLTLNTVIHDGSVQETAERLLIMFEECLDVNFGSIQTLRESRIIEIPAHFADESLNKKFCKYTCQSMVVLVRWRSQSLTGDNFVFSIKS